MSKFIAFLNDESGASAAEYVLILAIMGTVLVTALTGFSGSIAGALDAAATFLDDNHVGS